MRQVCAMTITLLLSLMAFQPVANAGNGQGDAQHAIQPGKTCIPGVENVVCQVQSVTGSIQKNRPEQINEQKGSKKAVGQRKKAVMLQTMPRDLCAYRQIYVQRHGSR